MVLFSINLKGYLISNLFNFFEKYLLFTIGKKCYHLNLVNFKFLNNSLFNFLNFDYFDIKFLF
jgi:hypothetical protein